MVDAIVTVNITEHQSLERLICMMQGDAYRGEFSADIKVTVQYGENIQALSVVLNTVGAVSVKRTHEILSGVCNILIATGTISSMVKRCAGCLADTVGKSKQKMTRLGLGHFDETELGEIKSSGGFMTHPTVNIPIWISVLSAASQVWINAVCSQDFRG